MSECCSAEDGMDGAMVRAGVGERILNSEESAVDVTVLTKFAADFIARFVLSARLIEGLKRGMAS